MISVWDAGVDMAKPFKPKCGLLSDIFWRLYSDLPPNKRQGFVREWSLLEQRIEEEMGELKLYVNGKRRLKTMDKVSLKKYKELDEVRKIGLKWLEQEQKRVDFLERKIKHMLRKKRS